MTGKPFFMMEAENSGPQTRGPMSTFATRDLMAKVDVGPQVVRSGYFNWLHLIPQLEQSFK